MMSTNAQIIARGLATLALVAGITGCAWIGTTGDRDPVPRKEGMYAVQDGKLQRLSGDRKWELKTWNERSNLAPGARFVIRHPQLPAPGQPLEQAIRLSRVAWVRSEITQEGNILPVNGNQWEVTQLEQFQVPIRIQALDSKRGVARVIPEQTLQHGLYSLQLRTASGVIRSRLGVDWSNVDKRAYSASSCVDRYLGDSVHYRPCSEQEHALTAKWLKVHLVDPESYTVAGQRTLVVKGIVVNTSDRRRKLPLLEAQLRSASGEVLKRWPLELAIAEIEPGASARFRSEIANPPPGAQNVHVNFSSGQASPSRP